MYFCKISATIDTGSSRSIINMETYNTIKRKSDLLKMPTVN